MGEFLMRPYKPAQQLSGDATDAETIRHYSMMLRYWVAEAKWQEARVAGLLAIRAKRPESAQDKSASDPIVTSTSGPDPRDEASIPYNHER